MALSNFSRSRLPWRSSPRRRRAGAPTTRWGESTFEVARWERARKAGRRWALWGVVLGALIGLVLFAPAAWLAGAVAQATGERLLLADARGSVWSGSAVVVLTAGPGSRDARSLPGRIDWTLRPAFSGSGLGLLLQARHACCVNGVLGLRVQPGLGRVNLALQPGGPWVGQWPSAWLGGLGTPWNTLQLGGAIRLASRGLTLEWVQGRLRVEGVAEIDLVDVSSRLTTLDRLGSYRLTLSGDAANAGAAQLQLQTMDGVLQLTGSGQWGQNGMRFRGEARANEKEQAALNNLLNIIGRRDGARSVISIG